jgi:hypothetical protein
MVAEWAGWLSVESGLSSSFKETAAGLLERRVSFLRDSAAFRSNSRSFIRRQQHTINGQNVIRADRRTQTSNVTVHTRPLQVLVVLDETFPYWVAVNVFDFLLIFLNTGRSGREVSIVRGRWAQSSIENLKVQILGSGVI